MASVAQTPTPSGHSQAALPAATAARLAWQPPSLLAGRTFWAAATAGPAFGASLIADLLQWHDQMSNRGDTLTAAPRL
jgi:hypothetical protein